MKVSQEPRGRATPSGMPGGRRHIPKAALQKKNPELGTQLAKNCNGVDPEKQVEKKTDNLITCWEERKEGRKPEDNFGSSRKILNTAAVELALTLNYRAHTEKCGAGLAKAAPGVL